MGPIMRIPSARDEIRRGRKNEGGAPRLFCLCWPRVKQPRGVFCFADEGEQKGSPSRFLAVILASGILQSEWLLRCFRMADL